MNEILESFQLLRPEWLLAILPALLMAVLLLRSQGQHNSWQQVIDPQLLPHLLEGSFTPQKKRGIITVFILWLLTCLALAGPVWEKIAVPIHKKESALIILFDLSPSMLAEDIKPSRLIRAHHKMIDLLRMRTEGLSALIAYAGEAHVVAPLTDDTETLENLLPALHPNIMPLRGNNPEMAVEKALELIKDAGLQQADLLFVTDEIPRDAATEISSQLQGLSVRVSVLGVGTQEGAPIPFGQGGFAKDNSGNIVIASLNRGTLQTMSSDLNGHYADLRPDNKDLEWLNDLPDTQDDSTRQLEREFDNWHEYGQWLALLLLPFAAYLFRRGLVLTVLCVPLLATQTQPVQAMEWDDLWLRKDQQAQKRLQAGDAQGAAEQFEDPQWRGKAQYEAGDFKAAAETFAANKDSKNHYNRGNALAKGGKLDEAIEAYDEALALKPDYEDAQFNRDLVEKLKQQQEQQQQDQSQDSDDENNEDQKDEGQNQDSSEQQNQGEDSKENQEEQSQGSDQDSEGQPRDPEDEQQEESEQEQSEKEQQEQKEQEEQESQEQEQSGKSEEEQQREAEAQAAQAEESELNDEQKQALEQWLRQVPDDPGGLLRRKFEYQHRQLRKDYQRGDWQPPGNSANQRW